MMYLVALALLSIVPVGDDVLRDRCDLAEMHNFYDEHGRLIFTQLVWWSWNPREHRMDCIDWRLCKQPAQIPERGWERGGFMAAWLDGEQMRVVRSNGFIESWGQVDVELIAREVLPKDQRRGLSHRQRPNHPAGAIRPSPIPVAAPDLP
jgi:hypothetical protein